MSPGNWIDLATLALFIVFGTVWTWRCVSQRHASKSITVRRGLKSVEVTGLPAGEALGIARTIMDSLDRPVERCSCGGVLSHGDHSMCGESRG